MKLVAVLWHTPTYTTWLGRCFPPISSRLMEVSKKPEKVVFSLEVQTMHIQLVTDMPERTKLQEMEVACGSPVEDYNLESNCFLKDWLRNACFLWIYTEFLGVVSVGLFLEWNLEIWWNSEGLPGLRLWEPKSKLWVGEVIPKQAARKFTRGFQRKILSSEYSS